MKVAVTCENGTVFQHFGHTPEFAIFDVEDGKILSESVKTCGDSGHGALAGLLADEKVSVLICGGIGGGAINALKEAGILVVGGMSGPVRTVVENWLAGKLPVNLNFMCHHHDHEGEGHNCHDHKCGDHCH